MKSKTVLLFPRNHCHTLSLSSCLGKEATRKLRLLTSHQQVLHRLLLMKWVKFLRMVKYGLVQVKRLHEKVVKVEESELWK